MPASFGVFVDSFSFSFLVRVLSGSSRGEFSQEVIKKHAIEDNLEDTQCPTKPVTHAFLQLETEMDRNGFHRLTSRQQYTVEQRTIQFKPDFNPEERYLQKQLGFEILPQHNLRNTIERIDRHQKQISVKGMIDGQYESKSMRKYGTVDDKK